MKKLLLLTISVLGLALATSSTMAKIQTVTPSKVFNLQFTYQVKTVFKTSAIQFNGRYIQLEKAKGSMTLYGIVAGEKNSFGFTTPNLSPSCYWNLTINDQGQVSLKPTGSSYGATCTQTSKDPNNPNFTIKFST